MSNRVLVLYTGSNSRKIFIYILGMCFVVHCFQISLFASGKCLESVLDPVHRKKFTFQGVEVPLTIAYSERVSHRVTAQLTKILLEEGLGYDNVLLVPDSREELCDGMVSLKNCVQNRTSCIPDAMIDTEVWTPFDSQKPREIDRMVDVGSIGVMGRQGWYTTAQFVDREWAVHQQPADHWRALQLHDVMQQLYQNSNLITCQECVEYEFNPAYCVGGRQCVTLLAGNKDNGSVLVENQIKSLELNISMVWLRGNLSSTVLRNEALGKPLLFFAWDPDPLTVSDKFKRISFPQCSFPWMKVTTNTTSGESMRCDFPLYDLHKFVWKPIRRFYSDIYKLVKAITLTRENIADILRRFNTKGKSASVHDTICRWLLRSLDVWLPWVEQEGAFKDTIYIGGMFPSLVEPKAVWLSPGDEIGAHMAVQEVNNDRNTLPRFRLKLLVTPTQCRRDLVIKAFIRYLNRIGAEQVVGIIGPACSKATIPIAKVSRFYNTIVMGYGAEDESLSDRRKFPLFYRTNPSTNEFKYAYLSIFRTFGWKNYASLREGTYPVDTVRSRTEYLTKHGVQVLSRETPSETNLDATGYIASVIESKKTIIVLDTFPPETRMFICEAYKKGLTPDKGYVWFLVDWLNADWWNVDFYNSQRHAAPEMVPCSTAEMKLFVEQGYLTLSAPFFGEDEQNVFSGGTVKDWKEEYQQHLEKEGIVWSDYASFTHDAVWTYALALDKLLRKESAALRTIQSHNTSEVFRSFIQQTDFIGVSGRVQFKNGDRVSNVLIKQKFATHSVVIGKFIPVIGRNDTESGRLDWDVSKITWAAGALPSDLLPDPVPKPSCDVEALRQAMGVTCTVATIVAVFIGLTCVVVILVIVVWILKGRYSSKYRDTKNRLRELGLDNVNFSIEIFALDEWEIAREKVFLNRKLGEGAFGAVFGGEWVREEESEYSVPVAVKTLRGGATTEEKVEFLSEAGQMKLFSHPNLVKLLAVCTAGEPVYIVMELMIHGDLKNFLLARRRLVDQPDSPEAEEVTPRRLTMMALQIAQGLQYLAKMKFVHRDLALRNCMVGFGNVIKIGDFGLARSLQGTDYYRYERKAMLPVRWMSPESIREGLFTLYTDVWSYGVTLWELSSFGGFPYQELSNAQVLEKVERGLTLEIPQQSSNEMKSLLCRCWSQDPFHRPKAETIVQVLTENPEIIHPCVNVPATNLLDNSVGTFDATKPTAQPRRTIESPQSEHSFYLDHVTSSTNLTSNARDKSVVRKH